MGARNKNSTIIRKSMALSVKLLVFCSYDKKFNKQSKIQITAQNGQHSSKHTDTHKTFCQSKNKTPQKHINN
jgi:hypothetical protein